MKSLAEDLQTPKINLTQFAEVTVRVLNYIENVITYQNEIKSYILYLSSSAGTTKYVRPVKKSLFFLRSIAFMDQFNEFIHTLNNIKHQKRNLTNESYFLIDQVIYTIQQSMGIGLDLLVNPNSARKHVGNRFEELIRLVITELGISNKKIILKIPYTQNKKDVYSCETDLIFSPYKEVKSNSNQINSNEIVVSLKTTSKDRLGKIFIDKLLMQKFVGHDVKVVGIFLNDVQRKGKDDINYTFVSGLFMVYTKFLTRLEGLYFIDMPPKIKASPFNKYIFPFSKFIIEDIWNLIP